MSVYFIGCLHLGHENIAKMRGFESSAEHDRELLAGINSVISNRDKLFILGDLTMETAKHYHLLDQIKGVKHVIMGNHDRHIDVPRLLEHVDGVCGCLKYKNWMLSHVPIHPIEFDYRVKLNVHAHLHGQSTNDPRYYNVDAARLGYVPKSYDEIHFENSAVSREVRHEPN